MAQPRQRPARTLSIALLRLWFRIAARVAPPVAERHAAALFLTPKRRAPRAPEIPGHTARHCVVRAAGHDVAAWSWGVGPVVLLVHGWSGRGSDMAVLAASLVRSGFRAVIVDMPAHGRSPGRRTNLAEWVAVLNALAERMSGRFGTLHAIVAHSFGSAATTLALEAGVRARGVVLLAPAQGPALYLGRVRRFLGLGERHAPGIERQLVRRIGREIAYFDAARAAATLDVPALVVHDPADDEVPWAQAVAIAGAWRGSRLVAAPDVGHNGVLTAPAFVDVATRFVLELGGVAAAAAS